MPPPFNHPARVAERISMLDLVSAGRADFGTGESSSEAELGGFLIDPIEKRAMWEEGLRVALRCMTETPFTGHGGEHVTMPPRNVVPKPLQKPHPPVWVACSRRDTIHLAAQHGIGALAFAFIDPEEAQHWVDDYHDTLENDCVPIGDAVNPNIACVTHVHVPRRRRRGDAPRPRGRELLRLLARALLRVRPASARRHRRVGRVPCARAPSRATTRTLWTRRPRDEDRLGAKVVQQGRLLRHPRRRRHTRPDP